MSWLEKIFNPKENSGSVAKTRLQRVLTHDRSNVTPGLLEEIKDDIIEVIAKRLAIDPDNEVVKHTQTQRESRLVAEIPSQANGRK
jgi:cell division topological specificity factor